MSNDDVYMEYLLSMEDPAPAPPINPVDPALPSIPTEAPVAPAPERTTITPHSIEVGTAAGRAIRAQLGDTLESIGSVIIGGARDAAQGAIGLGADLGNFLREMGVPIPQLNTTTGEVMSADEVLAARKAGTITDPTLPDPIPPSDSLVEGFGRGIVAFLLPFLVTGGAGGATASIRLGRAAASGAFADATMDPKDGTMIAMLSELEAAGGPDLVPDFLAFLNIKAGEEATGTERLKTRLVQAAEGTVLGTAIDGVIEAFGVIRRNGNLKKTATEILQQLEGLPVGMSIKDVSDAKIEGETVSETINRLVAGREGVTPQPESPADLLGFQGTTSNAEKLGQANLARVPPEEYSPAMLEALETGDLADVIRVAQTEEQIKATNKATRGLEKLPDQRHAVGDPNVPRQVSSHFDARLDDDGVAFMKWMRNNRHGKILHPNQKTAASIDFSTTCGKRSCSVGSCLYCYVDEGRVINKARDEAIAGGGSATDTGLGSAQAKVDKLEHNFDPEIFNRMPKSVIDAFNMDGGLRMFSFGDFREGIDDANVKATLDAALERGLFIKATTKSREFVEQFGDHPALRINISMDNIPGDISNAFTREDAIALKARFPNLRIRSVAVNREEVEQFGAMVDDAGQPLIDVLTLYHGKTNFKNAPSGTPADQIIMVNGVKKVRTDSLSKVIMLKLDDPEFTPPGAKQVILDAYGGEEGFRAWLDTWESMEDKTKVFKGFIEKFGKRMCCRSGKCASDPTTKCGFGVVEDAPIKMIGFALGLAGAAYPELSPPDDEVADNGE